MIMVLIVMEFTYQQCGEVNVIDGFITHIDFSNFS